MITYKFLKSFGYVVLKGLIYSMLFLSLTFIGCGSKSSTSYSIAIDPSFFPLNIQGREENVYVFLHDLLQAIGKEEGVVFSKVNASWDILFEKLKQDKYDAVITSLMPYIYNQSKYDFSDMLLQTGPVLVVRYRSNIDALSDMSKGLLFVQNPDEQQMVMERYPTIITQVYDIPAPAFERVLSGYADGMFLESIDAVAYVSDLYAQRLRIAEGPYGESGLRIVTKKGENASLRTVINEGLKKLKANGTYDMLAKKWRIK